MSGDGEEVTIPAERLGVRPDVEETVRNARKVGREGNVFKRIRDRAGGLVGTVEVPLEVAYDGEKVRAAAGPCVSSISISICPTARGTCVPGEAVSAQVPNNSAVW